MHACAHTQAQRHLFDIQYKFSGNLSPFRYISRCQKLHVMKAEKIWIFKSGLHSGLRGLLLHYTYGTWVLILNREGDRSPQDKRPPQTLMGSLVTQWLLFETHCCRERLIWHPFALGCPQLHVLFDTSNPVPSSYHVTEHSAPTGTSEIYYLLAAETERGNKRKCMWQPSH